MLFLFLLLVLAATTAAIWFQGLWSAAITLVNLLLAMLIATNFFEPICTLIEGFGGGSFTYLLDFIVLWVLFAFVFLFLRLFTDMLSKTRVHFDMPVEMAGRSILALWCGWLMVCFVAFSLQFAPLNSPAPLGAFSSPTSTTFLVVSPDRLWLGFMQMVSRGSLARGNFSGQKHPNDKDVEAFDPNSEFPVKYYERRVKYSADGMSLRVN
jgi:hypothetical protein